MAQLDPATVAQLAQQGLLDEQTAAQFSPQPGVPESLQPNVADPSLAPADVVAQNMPALEPQVQPGTGPVALPPQYINPSEMPVPGGTLADNVQLQPGQTVQPPEGYLQEAPQQAELSSIDQAQQIKHEEIQKAAEDAHMQAASEARGQKSAVLKSAAVDQQLQANAEQNVQQKMQQEDQAGFTSLSDIMGRGSFGQKFGAALAVLAGSISQAFTGAKENPALAALNNAFEQEMSKKKMSLAERENAQKAMLEQAKLKLEQAAQATDSDYKRSIIAQNAQEMQLKIDELKSKQAQRLAAGEVTKVLQAEGASAIPAATPEIAARNKQIEDALAYYDEADPKRAEGLRERQLLLPNGEMVFAKVDPTRVKAFEKDVRAPNESALNTLRQIKEFAKTASSVNPADRARMQTELSLAAGKLRIPITGPGAMTEDEYKRLLDTLGNPTALMSVNSIEKLKLDTVMKNLDNDLRVGAAQIGVRWPKNREQLIAEKLAAKGYNSQQIEAALRNKK